MQVANAPFAIASGEVGSNFSITRAVRLKEILEAADVKIACGTQQVPLGRRLFPHLLAVSHFGNAPLPIVEEYVERLLYTSLQPAFHFWNKSAWLTKKENLILEEHERQVHIEIACRATFFASTGIMIRSSQSFPHPGYQGPDSDADVQVDWRLYRGKYHIAIGMVIQ